jgi:hypothetical protein
MDSTRHAPYVLLQLAGVSQGRKRTRPPVRPRQRGHHVAELPQGRDGSGGPKVLVNPTAETGRECGTDGEGVTRPVPSRYDAQTSRRVVLRLSLLQFFASQGELLTTNASQVLLRLSSIVSSGSVASGCRPRIFVLPKGKA